MVRLPAGSSRRYSNSCRPEQAPERRIVARSGMCGGSRLTRPNPRRGRDIMRKLRGMMYRMDPVQIAVVGVGGWGKNLARNFHQLPDANLKYVCDLDQKKLDQGARQLPG